VEFIDPDSEGIESSDQAIIDVDKKSIPQLKRIILDPKGYNKEVADLRAMLKEHIVKIENADWKDQKQNALDQMTATGFWESENRYQILNCIEIMDRMEAGFKSAVSIMDRLSGLKNRDRKTYPVKLIKRLASLLYLLDQAYLSHVNNLPHDAFLMVECNQQSSNMNDKVVNFIHHIKKMYLNWAKNRRMQYTVIKELKDQQRNSFCTMLAVNGFGAYRILKSEQGLHVFEVPKDSGRSFDRYNVRVVIAAQPDIPVNDTDSYIKVAEKELNESSKGKLKVVRRYREEPSGLVRDSINNWRTGRIDQIYAGNFDLFS
jgi:ATP-dependent Clp protease ATP-binding subunit ClpC